MSLQFKFIANACGIFSGSAGSKILCDPWLVDGVFEGSWCHPFKLKTTFNDIKDVAAIYISHVHPDHFDERFFSFARTTPIIILDREPNFLLKKIDSMGFKNIIKVKNEVTINFAELSITLFSPFAKNNFHDCSVGNIIDSAILIESNGVKALNSNDNRLTPDYAEKLYKNYGSIDLAMLNYNNAGPYPSCFLNLDDKYKELECERLVNRNIDYLIGVIEALRPTAVLPFAGAYVLGGSLSRKNKYLGTMTWDECANRLNEHFTDSGDAKIITLREGDTIDLPSLQIDNRYIPVDHTELNGYIYDHLSKVRFPYQSDLNPDKAVLIGDLQLASKKMLERMNRYGIISSFNVILDVYGLSIQVYPEPRIISGSERFEKILECRLDERLLRRILDRKSHWNNAEIGAHIDFFRHPNVYEPDLHLGLQFLHL